MKQSTETRTAKPSRTEWAIVGLLAAVLVGVVVPQLGSTTRVGRAPVAQHVKIASR